MSLTLCENSDSAQAANDFLFVFNKKTMRLPSTLYRFQDIGRYLSNLLFICLFVFVGGQSGRSKSLKSSIIKPVPCMHH